MTLISPSSPYGRFVITGASGAGKSTLLTALQGQGFTCVPEIALAVLREQEASDGPLRPWTQPQAFLDEVLLRSIRAYDAVRELPEPVFFDRGIPECLAHMQLLGLTVAADLIAAAAERRYADPVFVAQPWPEIYVQDQWRRATFERSARSFDATVNAYTDLGYRVCLLPKVSVEQRVKFVVAQLGDPTGP